jgi:hypothetical protein
MKKYGLLVSAIQLIAETVKDSKGELLVKKTPTTFLGGEVRTDGAEAFAQVPYKGTMLMVREGQWVVVYDDGTMEVYTDEQFQETFVETASAELEEEGPKEKHGPKDKPNKK